MNIWQKLASAMSPDTSSRATGEPFNIQDESESSEAERRAHMGRKAYSKYKQKYKYRDMFSGDMGTSPKEDEANPHTTQKDIPLRGL